jgi:DNA-binding SARP family transcriptional activator
MQILAAEVVHSPLLQDLVDRFPSGYGGLGQDLKRLRDARQQPLAANKPRAQLTPEVTYSLRVLSLGRETVERDGVPVATSEWRANSAQELFLYLLFEGPQTRENISLEFWPESSAKRVRSNFHTTMYRARHALGENVILFEDEIYQINPDLDLWCDAQEFESLTRQASFLSPRDARTEDLWRRAVDLYRGDFLPSFEADWIVARRERLNEAYLEALIGLGQCARARGAFKTALNSFKRALEVDPYREDIHRDVLHCYADLGEKNQVLTHLKKLRDLFRQDLSVEPSSETLALARTLLR